MGKHRKKNHSSRKMTIPIALLAPAVLLASPGLARIVKGDLINGTRDVGYAFTGIAVNDAGHVAFNPAQIMMAGTAILGGLLVHRYLGKPINQGLARAHVPLLRV